MIAKASPGESNPFSGHGDMWQGNQRVQTQQEFYQAHAVEGQLSPTHMAEMLLLPEMGDTNGAAPGAGASGKAGQTTVEGEGGNDAGNDEGGEGTAGDKPKVILAKDGVHTIPYDKLEESRRGEQAAKEEARAAKDRADELERQLVEANAKIAAAPAPAPAAAPAAAPAPAAAAAPAAPTDAAIDPAIFGDYSDAALANGIAKLVELRVAPLKAELEQYRGTATQNEAQKQLTATESHFSSIYEAHPNLDSMLESAELEKWITTQPTFVQPALRATLDTGTATEVIELFDAFNTALGRPARGFDPAAHAAAQAAAAIANAKPVRPTSLSELSAGASAHHDEAAATLEMSPTALLNKFEGMSPTQINALLSRAL